MSFTSNVSVVEGESRIEEEEESLLLRLGYEWVN